MTKSQSDTIDTKLAVMANNIEYIKADIIEIKEQLKKDYVTREEFSPIKKIVYGLVSLILVAVVGAMVALILK